MHIGSLGSCILQSLSFLRQSSAYLLAPRSSLLVALSNELFSFAKATNWQEINGSEYNAALYNDTAGVKRQNKCTVAG